MVYSALMPPFGLLLLSSKCLVTTAAPKRSNSNPRSIAPPAATTPKPPDTGLSVVVVGVWDGPRDFASKTPVSSAAAATDAVVVDFWRAVVVVRYPRGSLDWGVADGEVVDVEDWRAVVDG